MTHIPGFLSAERAWENKSPFDGEDNCEDGSCADCESCLADIAEAEAEDYAEMQREERQLERRYGW